MKENKVLNLTKAASYDQNKVATSKKNPIEHEDDLVYKDTSVKTNPK